MIRNKLLLLSIILLKTSFIYSQVKEKNEILSKMLQSIPSPIEISTLIKENGVEYNKTYLNNPEQVDKYKSKYKRALNLGVYSTNLGYANLYQQQNDAFLYLSSVKKLADSLDVGKHIDLMKIASVANQGLNVLLAETTSAFSKINDDFWVQDKSELSALILIGGWVETLYLTCSLAKKTPNAEHDFSVEQLNTKIVEQKIILEELLEILKIYKGKNTEIDSLLEELKELDKTFKNVKIKNEKKQNSSIKVEKVGNWDIVVYEQGSNKTTNKSKVEIPKENLENILKITASIRSKIIE